MKPTTKQEQAVARQKKYDALTDEQKLELLDTRPGNSARERARINKRLSK